MNPVPEFKKNLFSGITSLFFEYHACMIAHK